MSAAERREAGLPTQEAFAAKHGITERTVIRWKKEDPITRAAFEAAERRRAGEEGPVLTRRYTRRAEEPETPEAPDEVEEALPDDPGLAEFELIRRDLAKKALKHGGQDLATYMKYFGAQILEQEKAQENSSFAELSDDELVDAVLTLVGRPAVEAWLARL